jgi:hypothetical protein
MYQQLMEECVQGTQNILHMALTAKLYLQALVCLQHIRSAPHSEIKEEVYPVPIEYKQMFDKKAVDGGTMMKVR